jgi:type IV pilus assembly protein PilA
MPSRSTDKRSGRRSRDESGFTLIELLVVILIIAILTAIAIPAFLSQTGKANDAAAKTQVGTLQTAERAYAAEHNGSYTGGSLAELQKIEPTLKDTSTATPAVLKEEAEGFEVQSTAKDSGGVYKVTSTKGAITRTCAAPSKGGCPAGGTW